MKNLLFLAFVSVAFFGCTQSIEYQKHAEVEIIEENLSLDNPLTKGILYIDPSSLKSEKFKSSTALGRDDTLKISLGEFCKGASENFFSHFFTNLQISDKQDVLETNDLIIIPTIKQFKYGFYSADGIDVTARPYVSYEFNLKMFKNKKLIYNKNISINEKYLGESEFFGGGNAHYTQIAPVFQKGLSQDYKAYAREIIDTINLAH